MWLEFMQKIAFPSSEAKYHATCYKNFVSLGIIYSNANKDQRLNKTHCPLQTVFEAVYRFCEDSIAYPNVITYKVVEELFLNKASELGETVSESHKKKIMRKLWTKFPKINFITYQYNKVLMYPNSLVINKVILDFLAQNRARVTKSDKDCTINYEILDLESQMSLAA